MWKKKTKQKKRKESKGERGESSKEDTAIVQPRGGSSSLDHRSKKYGHILDPFSKGEPTDFASRLNMGT